MKGIFVGYDTDFPSFRVFVDDSKDVESVGNVTFDDSPNTVSFGELKIPFTVDDNEEFKIEKLSDESSKYDSCESKTSDNRLKSHQIVYIKLFKRRFQRKEI